MLLLLKSISKKKCLYIDLFNKKDPVFNKNNLVSINRVIKILGKNKNIKMQGIKHIILKNKYIIFCRLRLKIQFIKSRFKLI